MGVLGYRDEFFDVPSVGEARSGCTGAAAIVITNAGGLFSVHTQQGGEWGRMGEDRSKNQKEVFRHAHNFTGGCHKISKRRIVSKWEITQEYDRQM
jgi:hypothetical protein